MAWTKFFTVEVILLFCGFSMILEGSVYTNLYIYRTCYVLLGYNKSDCAQLGNEVNDVTKHLEPLVQPTVNKIHMVQSVTGTLFPMLFNMYVGTWSDKFGRKPFLLLTLIGVITTTIGNTLIIHFEDASPWWFIMTSIPSLVTGGFGSMFMVISAYLVDSSTTKDRAIRFSIFDIIIGFTSFVGSLVSAPLLYATSYQMIFIIGTILQTISFLYTLLFIPESVKKENSNKVPRVGDLLNNIGLVGIVKDVFRKRENNGRAYLIAIIVVQLILGFPGGEMSVASLFLRNKLHWTLTKMNTVHSFTSVLSLVGTLLGTFVLYKTFHFKELHLALFATITATIGNLLWGIATNDYYIYATYAINIFRGLSGLMWKTLISYMVAPDEIGKLYAIQSIFSSLNGLLANLVYTNIYNATINIDSGIFNFVSFGFHIVVIIIILFMLKLKIPRYQAPPEVNDETETNSKKISINNNNKEIVDTHPSSKKSSLNNNENERVSTNPDSKKSSLDFVVDISPYQMA